MGKSSQLRFWEGEREREWEQDREGEGQVRVGNGMEAVLGFSQNVDF